MGIKENLRSIRERINQVAKKAGRNPKDIILVAATKNVDSFRIREAMDNGIRIVGENRVQEAKGKFQELGEVLEWHFIGHLQTNKVREALNIFSMIQSVDSLRVAKVISQEAMNKGKIQEILLEVNVGEEVNKFGFREEELIAILPAMASLPNLRILGLMTVPPYLSSPENGRPYFRKLRKFSRRLEELGISEVKMQYLSMGMSHDFEVAIEEGANMVRIGTAIFGPRS
jgi:hypothetical protein